MEQPRGHIGHDMCAYCDTLNKTLRDCQVENRRLKNEIMELQRKK
jgi:hypothetical protein